MEGTTLTTAPPWPNTPRRRRWKGVYHPEEGWKCECNPSLVALRLQAKRDTPNKGRWFFRCPGWEQGCDMYRWEDDPETQAMMGITIPRPNITASQTNSPSLPIPPPYNPSHPAEWARARPPPSPLGEKSSSKRPADEIEMGEETDFDEVEGATSDSSKYSDVPWETSDEDTVTVRAPAAGSSRKVRRTTTKDTPCKGRVSFASAPASASTSFATAPMTQSTSHRSRLAFDQGEDDIFTTRPLQKPPANSLISKLVAASVNPTTFTPETPHRHSGYSLTHLPSPNTPGTSRRTPGPIGLQTPSALTRDVFSFQTELGRISTDLETKLMELMSKQALQAEGFKRGRDINRKLLKDSREKVAALEKRIKELEAEKEMTRQVNENLKSQLDAVRLNSPSAIGSPRP